MTVAKKHPIAAATGPGPRCWESARGSGGRGAARFRDPPQSYRRRVASRDTSDLVRVPALPRRQPVQPPDTGGMAACTGCSAVPASSVLSYHEFAPICQRTEHMLHGKKVTLRALSRDDLPRQFEFNNDVEFELLAGGEPWEPQSLQR